jgi:hypothetical protein
MTGPRLMTWDRRSAQCSRAYYWLCSCWVTRLSTRDSFRRARHRQLEDRRGPSRSIRRGSCPWALLRRSRASSGQLSSRSLSGGSRWRRSRRLAFLPATMWPVGTVAGAIASIALLVLFFHPWLVLGLAIDFVLLWAVLVARWEPDWLTT